MGDFIPSRGIPARTAAPDRPAALERPTFRNRGVRLARTVVPAATIRRLTRDHDRQVHYGPAGDLPSGTASRRAIPADCRPESLDRLEREAETLIGRYQDQAGAQADPTWHAAECSVAVRRKDCVKLMKSLGFSEAAQEAVRKTMVTEGSIRIFEAYFSGTGRRTDRATGELPISPGANAALVRAYMLAACRTELAATGTGEPERPDRLRRIAISSLAALYETGSFRKAADLLAECKKREFPEKFDRDDREARKETSLKLDFDLECEENKRVHPSSIVLSSFGSDGNEAIVSFVRDFMFFFKHTKDSTDDWGDWSFTDVLQLCKALESAGLLAAA